MATYTDSIYTKCHKNIFLFPFMEACMGADLKLYEESLSAAKKMILGAANAKNDAERTFFWICRRGGSSCSTEQDVFLKDTNANWHGEHSLGNGLNATVCAFIIEVTDVFGPYSLGNVYEINQAVFAQEVRRYAQPQLVGQNPLAPQCTRACHAIPVDPVQLNAVLRRQRYHREELLNAS